MSEWKRANENTYTNMAFSDTLSHSSWKEIRRTSVVLSKDTLIPGFKVTVVHGTYSGDQENKKEACLVKMMKGNNWVTVLDYVLVAYLLKFSISEFKILNHYILSWGGLSALDLPRCFDCSLVKQSRDHVVIGVTDTNNITWNLSLLLQAYPTQNKHKKIKIVDNRNLPGTAISIEWRQIFIPFKKLLKIFFSRFSYYSGYVLWFLLLFLRWTL